MATVTSGPLMAARSGMTGVEPIRITGSTSTPTSSILQFALAVGRRRGYCPLQFLLFGRRGFSDAELVLVSGPVHRDDGCDRLRQGQVPHEADRESRTDSPPDEKRYNEPDTATWRKPPPPKDEKTLLGRPGGGGTPGLGGLAAIASDSDCDDCAFCAISSI